MRCTTACRTWADMTMWVYIPLHYMSCGCCLLLSSW